MTTPAISIKNLEKTFHLGFLGALKPFRPIADRLQVKGIAYRVDAVRNISLEVEPGQIYGFLGPNGAGKTTTLKILTGLIHPSKGQVSIFGGEAADKETRAKVGFLPEHPYFYEHLKPIEFLDFYGQLFRMSARERKKRAHELIHRVGLGHALGRPLRKFSKGMIQRMGLAQALINDPELVILDEPMSGLDPMGRKDVRDIIFELKERGKTVFFSSHILQDVEYLCDRVSILVHGQLRSEGNLGDLLRAGQEQVDITIQNLDEKGRETLTTLAKSTRIIGDRTLFTLSDDSGLSAFLETTLKLGGHVDRIIPQRRSLEELFVEEALREDPA